MPSPEKVILETTSHDTIELAHAPGDGPIVVLLHGASGNANTWLSPLEAWSWADVWCPDLPGRGGNSASALDSVEALADWAADVLDAIPSTKPKILVGHSLGGGVALMLGLRHPASVNGIVMASSSARLRVAPKILDAVANSTPEEPFELDFAFGPSTEQDIITTYARAARSTPPGSALADWRACDAFDVREQSSALSLPLLVAYGDEDVLTPAKYQGLLADAIEDAERAEITGAGHMLPWEKPTELSSNVEAWVKRRLL